MLKGSTCKKKKKKKTPGILCTRTFGAFIIIGVNIYGNILTPYCLTWAIRIALFGYFI